MKIDRIHHVAYRCKDAKETVDWYVKHLNMNFVLAIAEDLVPSTKAPDPYMHVFLDAGAGNVLAFFELPTYPEMGRDTNTPDWVQHIAFKVDTLEELEAAKARLQAAGIEVVGVTDHTIFKSIYFSNLDYGFYEKYIHTIKTITAEEIQVIAQKYLNVADMLEVVGSAYDVWLGGTTITSGQWVFYFYLFFFF